jgi:uncharacterized protein (DUF1330 family)
MPAYALFDNVDVRDPSGLEEYKRNVGAVVSRYGGRYVVLGGALKVVEGDWTPRFLVMIEFPSLEQATAWYDSPDYQALKALRLASVRSNGVLMGGVETTS